MNRFSEEYLVEQRRRLSLALASPLVACVDLEATCTNDPVERETYRNEIIEVGIALLDVRSLTVVETHQLYVKPTTTSVLPFCTELTGITPERVAQSPGFPQVMAQLQALVSRWQARGVTSWGSFGEYDRNQFARQCERERVFNPMQLLEHFNVKSAAQVALKSKKGLGLATAVQRLGLTFYGNHHSGMDDAVNVANVLAAVQRIRG